MAAGSDNEGSNDPTDYHVMLRKYVYGDDGDSGSVEDLGISLKQEFEATRNKISLLQSDVIEKQKSLDREREMRFYAEQELSLLSMDGERDNSMASPIFNSTFQDKHFGASVKNTSTPEGDNIDVIRNDLELAREQNRTLREKLDQVELSHERLSHAKEDMRLELDAEFTARGAALVDKIYTAQKLREESINHRLKRITDEKEELTKKLKKFEKDNGVDSGVETNSLGDELWVNADMSLDEIVGRVVNQNQSIEINGEFVVDRSGKGQNIKKRSAPSSNEFKKMKEERDLALKQVEQLTEELNEVKRERNLLEAQHRKNEKNRLKILQNQMKGVIKDRDKAIEKSQNLEEELEHLRLQQSLKNSLSNESSLRRQFNITLDEYKAKLEENDQELLAAQSSYDELHNRLNGIVDEKNEISLQLQEALAKSNDDKKRIDNNA